MTPEEAEKLKPGDRVLIEAIIREHENGIIDECGDVRISLKISKRAKADWAFINPEDIREKIIPPRRKFRKGDVVRDGLLGGIHFAIDDESDKKSVKISAIEDSDCGAICAANSLTLICPVEERTDRKEGV